VRLLLPALRLRHPEARPEADRDRYNNALRGTRGITGLRVTTTSGSSYLDAMTLMAKYETTNFALLEKAQQGDRAALGKLFEGCRPRLEAVLSDLTAVFCGAAAPRTAQKSGQDEADERIRRIRAAFIGRQFCRGRPVHQGGYGTEPEEETVHPA
jgi:hypothetical protein